MDVQENEIHVSPLDPMSFFPRFQHISEKILVKLDKQSLKNRGVARAKSLGWPNPDDQNFGVASHPKLSILSGFIEGEEKKNLQTFSVILQK